MAEPYYVAMSPHNYNSTTVGLAATVQAAAGMPNFIITEYFVNFEETGREVATQAWPVVDGYIALPTQPGLGIELVEEELLARPYEQAAPRALPRYTDER